MPIIRQGLRLIPHRFLTEPPDMGTGGSTLFKRLPISHLLSGQALSPFVLYWLGIGAETLAGADPFLVCVEAAAAVPALKFSQAFHFTPFWTTNSRPSHVS